MTEFLSDNAMFVVLAVVLVVWLGIIWYLRRIDKKVTEAEKKFGLSDRSGK